jgi:transposase
MVYCREVTVGGFTMTMGRRKDKQPELFIASNGLPRSPGHVFYDKLNAILTTAGFDPFVEELCRPYYHEDTGRPSLPPGVYFRMLFVGYFEGIDSQRGIAWRCSDSRSLQAFLGFLATETTPDHSSLTNIRQRLPQVVHDEVFAFVIGIAEQNGLVISKCVGVDATTLEANAAMKTLERRDSGADYKTWTRQLAEEAGLEDPSAEEVRRFDKKRRNKKMSNDDWVSPSDPDSEITKMKDGTTHLAYKAEHVVDLDTELVLAATILPATTGDAASLCVSVMSAEINLIRTESEARIQEIATDKGYHKLETLQELAAQDYRTYIPEPEQAHEHSWQDKPAEQERAYRNNRRRVKGDYGRRMQRLRSERVERSFAHVCETGGARRSYLRGREKVTKRYLMTVAAHNLSIVMRKLYGKGKPRTLQGSGDVWPNILTSLLWFCALRNGFIASIVRLLRRTAVILQWHA